MPSSKAVCWALGIKWLIERCGFAVLNPQNEHLFIYLFKKIFHTEMEVLTAVMMAKNCMFIVLPDF